MIRNLIFALLILLPALAFSDRLGILKDGDAYQDLIYSKLDSEDDSLLESDYINQTKRKFFNIKTLVDLKSYLYGYWESEHNLNQESEDKIQEGYVFISYYENLLLSGEFEVTDTNIHLILLEIKKNLEDSYMQKTCKIETQTSLFDYYQKCKALLSLFKE
jgi:hypothetical protein